MTEIIVLVALTYQQDQFDFCVVIISWFMRTGHLIAECLVAHECHCVKVITLMILIIIFRRFERLTVKTASFFLGVNF
jgi:hypothetical protein